VTKRQVSSRKPQVRRSKTMLTKSEHGARVRRDAHAARPGDAYLVVQGTRKAVTAADVERRAITQGLDGTETQEDVLHLLTRLVPQERAEKHRAELDDILYADDRNWMTWWGPKQQVDRRTLRDALWTIVRAGLEINHASGFTAFKTEWRGMKTRAIKVGVPLLRDLVEHLGPWDEAIKRHALPLLKRLEELGQDPARWTDPPNWGDPPFKQPTPGHPLGKLRGPAKTILKVAGVKDRGKQRELLRLIGIPPLPPL
jgi:hypothetical protein